MDGYKLGGKMRHCTNCGDELEDWEDGLCENCMASIINIEDISPNESDFV